MDRQAKNSEGQTGCITQISSCGAIPLATLLQHSPALSFVIPTGAKRSGGICGLFRSLICILGKTADPSATLGMTKEGVAFLSRLRPADDVAFSLHACGSVLS